VPGKESAIPQDPTPLRAAHTPNFPSLLREFGASLLVTTYQAGKLVLVRDEGDHLNTHYRGFQSPMGLALADAGGNRLDGRRKGSGFASDYALAFTVAQPVAVARETRVNNTTAGEQRRPAVAADAAENSVVVWRSDQDPNGGGLGVYARQFGPAGAPLGSEFRVNTTTAGNQLLPAVAAYRWA
jgi:hypothetical protein